MFSHLPENGDRLLELQEKLRQDSRDSFQVLKNPLENPVCSITIDEPNRCVVLTWKQYATQAQLRYIHESLLPLIREHHVCKILGDDTALPTIPSEDRFWIIEDWFPRAVQCGLRFAASKAPESYFGKLSISHIQASAPLGLECRTFQKLDDAKEWLATVKAA